MTDYLRNVNFSLVYNPPEKLRADEGPQGPSGQQAAQQRRGPIQSTEDPAINSLQRRAAEIDQRIARREQQLKDSALARGLSWLSDISAPDWLGDEGGDSIINILRARKEGILTDIEDIRRSRQQIVDQGGYGEGGFGAAVERGLGNAQSMYGALGAMVGDVESDDISSIIEGRSRTLRAGRGREEQEAYERFQAADGLWASAKELFTNPREMINIAIESLPSSVPSIAGSVVAGGATGIATRNPVAAQRAAAVGGGLGSFVTEYGNAMLETLANNGVDLDSPEALEQAIRDPKIMEEARDRGVKRGIAVGTFDAMSIILGGKLGGGRVANKIIGDTASAGTARRVAGYTAGGLVETGAQGAFGAAGEAAGQLVTEGEITSPQDIVAEFAGEIPTGVVESAVGSAIQTRRDQNTRPQEDTELAGALSAFTAQRGEQTETLALPDGISQELRDLGDLRVGDLSYTGQQLYSFAENNMSNPRIADIMSQPVSAGTKVQQVARVMNEAEAARVEPEAVRRIAEAVGGTTPVSQTKNIANGILSEIGDSVIDASPTLSAIRDEVRGDKKGKGFVTALRSVVNSYSPPARSGGTMIARPERGGDGSVIMAPDQVADEAQREREAQQAFRMADRRQERFDRATGTGQQQEDLRAGAPEPEAQFFLGENYGDLAGTPVEIVQATSPDTVRLQYESPTETDSSGRPVTISEEVSVLDVGTRVVRGTNRMSQDLESNLRNPQRGVGTDMSPRRSVDRTRTRAVSTAEEAGLPAIQPNLVNEGYRQRPPTDIVSQNAQEIPAQENIPLPQGVQSAPDQAQQPPAPPQDLPAPPRQLPAPNLTEREQGTPEAQDREAISQRARAARDRANALEENGTLSFGEWFALRRKITANIEEAERELDSLENPINYDNDPRMVEAMDRFDAAIDRVNETENTTEARKLAKTLIKEGVIDEDAYIEIDEAIKDETERDFKHDAAMSAIQDAIEQQRDNVAADIEEEIYSEADQRTGQGDTRYSGRVERAGRRTVRASEVVARTQPPRDTETAEADDAAPDIDYQAVIDDRLSKIEARGAQGRIVAKRLRALLKQSNYNPTQLYHAFQMGEVVSRVLPNAAKIDILFVPSVQASNPDAAAASGIDLGEEAAGSYQAYSISQSGFRGLITLSLSEDLLGASRENAAHEAFHVIQDMLQAYDPDAFEQIAKAFRDGMRIKDLDPSILRVLKTVRTGKSGSVYDSLISSFGDTPLSNFEAQAVAFGALVDAKDRGVPMKGLKASFVRVVDFVSGLFREFGSLLRRDGVRSVADIFEGYRAGTEQEFLNEFGAPWADGGGAVQYSGRRSKPPYDHPSIGSQVIAPPITATSTIPFLYNNGKTKTEQTPEERLALKDAVQFIQERSRAALQARFGVDRITKPDPKTDRYLMRAIASEAEAAILKERATGNRSALDWYTKAIEDAIDEASAIYPMLADDDIAVRLSNRLGIATKEDARVMFTTALAITSQNMKVRDNARATTEQFDIFLETGRFDPTKKYGTKAPSISNNLALANFMLERVFDGRVAELGQFLNTEFTVAELNKLGRALQNKEGLEKSPFNISGEMASEKVYGSAIFGPKIGNGFYQNLNRNFSPVTIDLWFMRLWGRLTGTLVGKDTALNKQIEALREAVEADAHPTTKVPDGFAERFNGATDGEVIGLGIELAAEWERQYKALQKQGMTSDQITQQGLKPEWAFKAVALAGQKKPNDAPASGSQRKWIRDVVNGAVKMLAKNGYDVTPADLQALVWYPEKDLVNLLKEGKLEVNLNVSYDTAFSELAAIRNADATSTNTDAGNRGGDGASRQGDGGRSAGQAAVAGDEALAAGAAQEEGDQVRRTLPADVRNRLIERGARYSGRTGRRDRGAGNRGGEVAPLEGAPKVRGGGPNADLVQVAEDYALENGIPLTRQAEYVTIDEDFSRRLAQAYEEMQDTPNDPVVREAYRDLIRQTRAQYDALERAGYRFTLFDDDSDPYGTNPWEAMRDLRNNKRMAVYSTVAGYGNEGAQFDVSRNPLLEDTGLRWPDQNGNPRPVLANDLFRAVHDAFGHGLEGAGFRARGEENAWQAHARLFTGPALGALTSETRGQNSWLNFGPYGDRNKSAGLFDTVFAEQKVGLMPEWTWTERVAGVRFSGRRVPLDRDTLPEPLRRERPNAPKFRDGPSLLGADTRSARRAFLENQYERFVNRALPIKQLVKEIGDEFNDSTNFARAEVLMGSVVATQTRDFRNEEIIPLLREISARGLTVEEVETYLHNKHAEERNTVIAGRNELFPDGGSGIATEDARRYLASLSDAKRKGLEAVEKKVRTITDGTLQLMVDSGVESPAAVAALRDQYKNWVPLFREGFDGGNPIGGRQRGSSVEGSSLRAAIGSERAVKNIIYNIASQRESAINRAENNRLSGTVLRAALENPDPAFWMVIDPSKVTLEEIRDQLVRMGVDPEIAEEIYKAPRKAAYNKETGMVESVVDNQFKRAPNVVATRVEGTDKFIVFNPNNELATRVAQAVRNDDMPVLDGLSGKLVEFIGPLTRIWSQMRTQYSPEFGPVNFVRDVENALINLDDTPLSGKQGAVFVKAMKYGNVFRVRNSNLIRVISAADSGRAVSPKDQKLADLFGRFEKAGGRTSIRNTFFQSDDPKKIEAQMQKAFKQIAAGRKSIPAEVASAVTVWNDTLEIATRLAIFETAIEGGMTDAQAAELAKTTTVNFQQRGQWTRELNAGYGFFNASIAGNSRNIQVMLSKGGKKIALWGVGLGVMQGIMLAMAGYEEDEPPEWVKDNAFIIPIPFTDKYLPIPMLHFYRAFPAIGRRMVETARGQLTVGEFLTGSVRAVVNAVNPLAYGASFIEFAAPSVLDMGVQYWQNLDGLGRRIYNEDFNDLNPTTGMNRARGDMTMMYAMYSKIAEGINAISGGDEFTRGEFSPTPEEIKFFVEETAPPIRFVYRSFGVAEKLFAGDDVEAIELPFLRRFYGQRSGKTAEGGKFYENVLELNKLRTTIRGRDEAGVDTSDIYEQNPIAELTDSVGSYYREVSDLRRERRRLILEGKDRAEIRARDEEITAKMKEFNDLVAEYREAEE